jgi:hypothetical protein
MHKITSFTGQARHGFSERMPAAFGMSRPHQDTQPQRRPPGPHTIPPDSTANLSFNVPFASTLAGPEVDDILHSNPGAFQRWTMPPGTPEGSPIHKLPVHASNVENLRRLCRQISELSGGRLEALVTSSEPKATQALHIRPQGLVTNVCISGDGELVHKMRMKILSETPILLVSTTEPPPLAYSQLIFSVTALCDGRHRSEPDRRRRQQGHSIQRPQSHRSNSKLHGHRYLPSKAASHRS